MRNSGKTKIAVLSAAAALVACTVGPDYKRPAAPQTRSYSAQPLPTETAAAPVQQGAAQRFAMGNQIPAQWWILFQSDELDRIVRISLEQNPTVAQAQAALRQAQENLRAQYGAELPQADVNISASRQRFSGAAFSSAAESSIFNLYNASVNVSYVLDIFGGIRRELEAFRSEVDYQQYQLEGTYLSLTANVVTTAVKEGSLRAQLQATQEILADQEKEYQLIETRFKLGAAARTDVLSQQTQLAQTRATLPPLEKELALTRHLLAVLTGRLPGDQADLPVFDLKTFTLPQELPVSLPSILVRQRPDVRASEALLHAASAQVGVATANLYPQITLTGGYGWETNTLSDLFNPSAVIWNFGAGLLQPLFHGGALSARRRAAVAAFEQALAAYRDTVLQAFRNVADALRALDTDARALKAQAEALAAARSSLELTRQQFRFGAVSYLSLLDAQRQYQQAQISLVQARALRLADTAALFQALGGGWWNRAGDDNPPAQ